ncbi:hypothetical protein MMC34_007088 [Xylographa carneopallida]|nr:hypothetical protein [Xylographa carneopallida]
MPSLVTENSTKSGIITSESGERHIPSSVRPDGTKRKEIRIRPGYKPPEDVEVYKNRTAESWKTRGSGGIPGLDRGDTDGDSKAASNKNAKRREARKKAKSSDAGPLADEDVEGNSDGLAAKKMNSSSIVKEEKQAPTSPLASEPDPQAEREKLARNLKKKLRQAKELKDKKDQGTNLLPEQFEKVIKINELIRQLDNLGFNADGEPKRD